MNKHFLKKTLAALAFALVVIGGFSAAAPAVSAQAGQCTAGECVNGYTCSCGNFGGQVICFADSSKPCGAQVGSEVIGAVTPPAAIREWRFTNGFSEIGLINFLSVAVRLATIIGGILTMINFVWAGFLYVTMAGNTSANEQVKDRLTYSAIGLVIIVSAYTVAGIIGLIFFGDASFILSPELQGATTP